MFVLVLQWDIRQWLIPQTLLYGALAALMVEAVGAAARATASARRRVLVLVTTAVLSVGLVAAIPPQVALFLSSGTAPEDDQENQANAAVRDMGAWIAANVPKGAGILTTWRYSYLFAWQDASRHEWRHTGTLARGGALRDFLPPVVDGTRPAYLLLTPDPRSDPVAGWAPSLLGSGAFRRVHQEYLPAAAAGRRQGLVLVEPTARPAGPAPARMQAKSVDALVRCSRALYGERYASAIRAALPHGIDVYGSDQTEGRRKVNQIYGAETQDP